MQLRAYLFTLSSKSRKVLERMPGTDAIRPVNDRYPVIVNDDLFKALIEAGDTADGFQVSAEAVFTKKELKEVTHFEIVCRKFLSENQKDYEYNAAVWEGTPFYAASCDDPIRLGSGFTLNRITLKPNMVGAIGDWTEEYVAGKAVIHAFEEEGLSGWSGRPILNLKTGLPYPDICQVFSDTVLNPAVIDCSVERIRSDHPEEKDRLRHLGCLSYSAADLANQPDFARTAEPWGVGTVSHPGWLVPGWLVSLPNTSFVGGHFDPY